jgi:hypothetical protein
VARVVDTYGGSAAWAKVKSIDERGRVEPAMRKGPGAMTRTWSGPGNLRVEIVYPDKTEVRALENGKGMKTADIYLEKVEVKWRDPHPPFGHLLPLSGRRPSASLSRLSGRGWP